MTRITRLPKVHPSRSPLDRLAPEPWTDIKRTRGPTSAEYALAAYDLGHGPSIGDMYEGLSSKILDSAFPEGLDLRVVGGFIIDADGTMSGQIDCMLVTGEGEKIPYSTAYKWPIWDVLAVVEVKKNLYGQDLADSFVHLRQVAESFRKWLFANDGGDRKYSLRAAKRTFSTITGVHAPPWSEMKSLSPPLQLIYHTLIVEQLAPVLIVLGYEGYKTETSLREGLWKFLNAQGPGTANGVPAFPHQITCNGHSLVKLNGQPYMAPMDTEEWTFYASTKSNPLWVMIELLWTKITNRFGVRMPWGEDLEIEVLNRLVSAKAIVEEDRGGWELRYTAMRDDEDISARREAWTPTYVSQTQFVVFNRLCRDEEVDTTDPEFISFIEKEGLRTDDFIMSMQRTGLVAADGKLLRLTTEELGCVIFPDGRFGVAENNTGRLFRYVNRLAQPK